MFHDNKVVIDDQMRLRNVDNNSNKNMPKKGEITKMIKCRLMSSSLLFHLAQVRVTVSHLAINWLFFPFIILANFRKRKHNESFENVGMFMDGMRTGVEFRNPESYKLILSLFRFHFFFFLDW